MEPTVFGRERSRIPAFPCVALHLQLSRLRKGQSLPHVLTTFHSPPGLGRLLIGLRTMLECMIRSHGSQKAQPHRATLPVFCPCFKRGGRIGCAGQHSLVFVASMRVHQKRLETRFLRWTGKNRSKQQQELSGSNGHETEQAKKSRARTIKNQNRAEASKTWRKPHVS